MSEGERRTVPGQGQRFHARSVRQRGKDLPTLGRGLLWSSMVAVPVDWHRTSGIRPHPTDLPSQLVDIDAQPNQRQTGPGTARSAENPRQARSFPATSEGQSVKTSVDRCATRFVDQLSSMANRQGGRRHRSARPAQGVGSAETVDGDQLQPSRRDVLTPRGAANASTCRNASKPHSAWSPFVGPSLTLVRPRVTT